MSNAGAVNVFCESRLANGLSTSSSVVFTADSIGIGGLAGAQFTASMY